jgi:hypothetical protein
MNNTFVSPVFAPNTQAWFGELNFLSRGGAGECLFGVD